MIAAINHAGSAALGVALILSLILIWHRLDMELDTRRFWVVAPLIGVLVVIGVGLREYAP